MLRACRSTRDRLIVFLLARAGLHRGELTGLRRSDLHLLPDSTVLGCPVKRARDSDFVFVNLFREPIGATMPPDPINALITDLSKRADLVRRVH